MKIQSIIITPKILQKLKIKLNYLNIPLGSNYEIHSFLSEQELGMFQIDSLTRLILKIDGVYLEGDEHAIKELLFNASDKLEIIKKSRKTTLYASLGLAAIGIVASYSSTANTKYATVDICFMPEILHSTPSTEFCKSGETIYRTSPKFLLSKDQSKPNAEFVADYDKFLIPAKGRKEKNWNKPSNPGYLGLAGTAVLITSASYWLYSQSNRRYSLEFPEYFGMLKTYTLKTQLETNSKNILAIGQNQYRTQFLNQNLISNAQGLELGFQSNSENLADRQQAIFEESQKQLTKQNILQDKMFELQLSELDKKISENVRDSSKAEKEMLENSEDSSGSKKSKAKKPTNEEVQKEGNDIVKACEGFKLDLEYVGSTTAPSIVRHRFKFRKDSQLKKVNDIKKLSEDLALNLGLEHDPRICRDKGEIVVEVPRKNREFPSIFEALEKIKKPKDKESLLILGGVNTSGEILTIDLVNGVDKHLLGSGTTNSGKTRGLYAQIAAIVKNYSPDAVKFAIYDGKKSLKIPKEMNPWLFIPTAFATEGEDFINELEAERFNRMEDRGNCEDLKEFNSLNPEKKKPFILAIFDEYSVDRELFEGDKPDNNLMKKLAKLSRSEGIHLFAIDQDGKDENISNRVKANLAIRIIYKMVDSKCSDYVGVESAEKLLGFGDVICKVEGIEHRCQMPNCSPEDLKKIVIQRVAELGLNSYSESAESIQDSKKASVELENISD